MNITDSSRSREVLTIFRDFYQIMYALIIWYFIAFDLGFCFKCNYFPDVQVTRARHVGVAGPTMS